MRTSAISLLLAISTANTRFLILAQLLWIVLVMLSRIGALNGRMRTECVRKIKVLLDTIYENEIMLTGNRDGIQSEYFTFHFIVAIRSVYQQMIDKTLAAGQKAAQVKIVAFLEDLGHMRQSQCVQDLIVDIAITKKYNQI